MAKKGVSTQIEDDGIIKVDLPKSDLTLILGIASIVMCVFLGIGGLILGILARRISNESVELYQLAPELYNEYSHKNIKAGRVCAKIGIILSAVFLGIILIFWVLREAILSIF